MKTPRRQAMSRRAVVRRRARKMQITAARRGARPHQQLAGNRRCPAGRQSLISAGFRPACKRREKLRGAAVLVVAGES